MHLGLDSAIARVQYAVAAINLGAGDWFLPAQWAAAGLPAPVRKLLEEVEAEGEEIVVEVEGADGLNAEVSHPAGRTTENV